MPNNKQPVKTKGTPHNCQDQFILNMVNPAIKNQTQAYQLAYGCKYETAGVNASRLLEDARIREKINNLKQEVQSRSIIDFKEQLEKGILDHLELVSSLKDTLRDPDDPTRLNMSPRADEVIVDYTQSVEIETDKGGVKLITKQMKARLNELLSQFEIVANAVVHGVQITATDNRKLLLDALKGGDAKLKMLGDYYGLFKQAAQNPYDEERWKETEITLYMEKFKASREEAIDFLANKVIQNESDSVS